MDDDVYRIICKDQGEWVLSSRTFTEYGDAVAYANTICPSREARVLREVWCRVGIWTPRDSCERIMLADHQKGDDR